MALSVACKAWIAANEQLDGNRLVAKAGLRWHHGIRVRLLFGDQGDVTHALAMNTLRVGHCEVREMGRSLLLRQPSKSVLDSPFLI